MKATIKWVDGVMFLAESGSGHSVVMDGALDQGGTESTATRACSGDACERER